MCALGIDELRQHPAEVLFLGRHAEQNALAVQSATRRASHRPADLVKPDNRRVRVLLQRSELLVLESGNPVQAVTVILAYGQAIEHPPNGGVLLLCRR